MNTNKKIFYLILVGAITVSTVFFGYGELVGHKIIRIIGTKLDPALMSFEVVLGVNDAVSNETVLGEEAQISFSGRTYPLHSRITSTVFWVGESAGVENGFISNNASAWDDNWKNHFGGTDSPTLRNGYYPRKFVPKENPFYVALPYNDFNLWGLRKKNIQQAFDWSREKAWQKNQSTCKNRWVKIIKDGKEAYAQWEDVGPFNENDFDYVFGVNLPKNKINRRAGIDVSPAVRDYLNLKDIDTVDWQFVDEKDVPEGYWKKIVTTRQVYWR